MMLIGLGVALMVVDPAAVPHLEAGHHCLRVELVGDTGYQTFPLGEFWMIAEVQPRKGQITVGFANQMPDSGEVLMSAPVEASTMPNGTLRFGFTDGWGNQGQGKLSPAGTISLEVVEPSDEGGTNITRNYGTYELNRKHCAGLSDPLQ